MFKKFIDKLKSKLGADRPRFRLHCNISDSNIEMAQFLTKHGFRQCGILKAYMEADDGTEYDAREMRYIELPKAVDQPN